MSKADLRFLAPGPADEVPGLAMMANPKKIISHSVYCADVESALSTRPAVAELAVIGAPYKRWARPR